MALVARLLCDLLQGQSVQPQLQDLPILDGECREELLDLDLAEGCVLKLDREIRRGLFDAGLRGESLPQFF